MVSSPGNMDMLKSRNLWVDSMGDASPSDIVVFIIGENEAAIGKALKVAEKELTTTAIAETEGGAVKFVPRTVAEGLQHSGTPPANMALISVPGSSATAEGLKALSLGLNVFMFSNNVSMEDEGELKRYAAQRNLFVMGPDCGTAFLDGVPLGFCNQLRRGNVGLIGASGTGLQQVSSLIHQHGHGVSQMIGLGGHDLKDEVGGVMMLHSLKVLDKDPATKTIVLISKPPSKSVSDKILDAVKQIKKRVVIHFVGTRLNYEFGANTLEDAALLACGLPPQPEGTPGTGNPQRKIFGLFSGGTFQAEASSLLKGQKDVTVIDLGDDEYTKGKPHPMIDFSTRLQFIQDTVAKNPEAILILDVVLGYGANEDPVGQLVPVLQKVKQSYPKVTVVTHVCGTSDDPQGFQASVDRLLEVSIVAPTNAAACRLARDLAYGRKVAKPVIPNAEKAEAASGEVSSIFGGIRAINIGVETFTKAIKKVGAPVMQLNWKPPAGGDRVTGLSVAELLPGTPAGDFVAKANATALSKVQSSSPSLIGVESARNVIPFLAGNKKALIHAGPPITWDRMCGPMQGAVIGAALFEGWAKTEEEARKLASSGEIAFSPCHEHSAVGPMAGVTGPSFPVWVVENNHGNKAFCNFNEGLGKVLRFGAFGPDVQKRLHWMRDTLAPSLQKSIAGSKTDLLAIIARALQMGDECHNRNAAASSLLFRALTPLIIKNDQKNAAEVLEFINSNDHFFLNLSMAACKASLDSGHGVPGSTLVTIMARNGVDFGIKLSGSGEWFTTSSPIVDGLLFPGYTKADANPDMGDSSITETFGIGGAAMAASPAITGFVGGNAASALQTTKDVYPIYMAKHPRLTIPGLDGAGVPLGLDALRVLETNVMPVINTGIAHKNAGIGQIGAGICRAPASVFNAGVKKVWGSLNQSVNPLQFAKRAIALAKK